MGLGNHETNVMYFGHVLHPICLSWVHVEIVIALQVNAALLVFVARRDMVT